MNKKIFNSIFTTSIIILFASIVLILGVMYGYFAEQTKDELKTKAKYLSVGIENDGINYLNSLKKVENKFRITWIDEDGKVLFDNMANPQKMDNHSTRAEFMDAKRLGEGESVRYSVTLSEKRINYALLLDDSSVLRVSGTEFTFVSLFMSIIYPIIAILILAALVSASLASKISAKIIKPINDFVVNENDEDLYDELKPVARKIAAQNKQIKHQMEELKIQHEKQDKLRREFTANVTHELKTPLTSISGFAEIIRDGLVKEEDIPHFADNIYIEAKRLSVLVSDILNLSKLEESEEMVESEDVDLYEVAKGVILSLTSKAKKKDVSLNLEGEHLKIKAIEYVIYEMMYNLIDNAIKYNKKFGKVDVKIYEKEKNVFLEVSDTGIGIAKENLDRVFERFYRENRNDPEREGTGLGLSIVKHAAICHNAKINIDSVLDKGTKIQVIFNKEF